LRRNARRRATTAAAARAASPKCSAGHADNTVVAMVLAGLIKPVGLERDEKRGRDSSSVTPICTGARRSSGQGQNFGAENQMVTPRWGLCPTWPNGSGAASK